MAEKNTLELEIKIAAQNALTAVKSMSSEIKALAQNAKTFSGADMSTSLKSVQQEAQKAATSIKLFGANSTELRNTQTKLKQAVLDLTQKGLNPQSDEIQKLVTQYKQLDKAALEVEKTNASSAQSFGSLKDAITTSATALAAIKAVDIAGDLAGYALQQADAFDTARKELGILLGDVQAGNALFEQLQDFNIKTPFNLETTQQATNVLLAAKVPVQDLQDKLTEFGDLSQGNTQKFTSFINAFSKGSAKGKADMEVLNVYLDQGIPILDELAKNANTTSAEIVKMASEGKISFTDFQTALESLTSEGGKYYGTMAIGAENLSGIQEGLKESVNALSASIGQALLPIVKEVLLVFTSIVNAINDSPIMKGVLAGAVVALTGYFVAMAVKTAILTAKTWLQQAAQMGLNASLAITNPLLLAGIAAATAATVAAVAYATAQNDAALATDAQADALKNLEGSAKTAMSYLQELDLAQAKSTAKSYEVAIIPTLQQDVDNAKLALENTPQTETFTRTQRGFTWTEEKETQEFKEAKAVLEEAESILEKHLGYQQEAIARVAELENQEFAKNLEEGNILLQRRNDLYAKTPEGQRENLVALLKEAQDYYTHVTPEEDGTWSGFDKAKTDAIVRDAQKALDDFDAKNANPEFIQSWTEKGLDSIASLTLEAQKAQDTVNEKALASFGENYKAEKAYIEETAALQEYYADKIAETQRNSILSQHQEKLDLIKEEYEYQKELARQQINNAQNSSEYTSGVASYASNSAMSAIQDTDLGKVISDVDPVTMIIDSLLSAVMAIDSVTESLNFIGTTVNALISFVEPLIDSIFRPIADIFKEIGEIAGQILSPLFGMLSAVIQPVIGALKILLAPLQLLADAFEWFYNEIIRTVGNGIISVMNAVIGALNKIPFVDIKKLDYLPLVGEKAEEMAKSMDQASETFAKLYERQIDSLKTQYELGLITGEQYDAGVEKYANQKGVLQFDVGTPSVPFDMPAMVHKGETIVPKTFADGIRSGEMALVGNENFGTNKSRSAGTVIALTVNVGGNVTSEKELSETIYDNLATLIQSGKKMPLPVGA